MMKHIKKVSFLTTVILLIFTLTAQATAFSLSESNRTGLHANNSIVTLDEDGGYLVVPEFAERYGGINAIFASTDDYIFVGLYDAVTGRASFFDVEGTLLGYLYVSNSASFFELVHTSIDLLSLSQYEVDAMRTYSAVDIVVNTIYEFDNAYVFSGVHEAHNINSIEQADISITRAPVELIDPNMAGELYFDYESMNWIVVPFELYVEGTHHIDSDTLEFIEMYGYSNDIEGLMVFLEPGELPIGIEDYFAPFSARGTVTLRYNGGGHTGGSPPTNHSVSTPGSISLRQPGSMTRTGHTFHAWRDDVGGSHLQPGFTMTFADPRNATFPFTAIWSPVANTTVVFHGNGWTPSRQEMSLRPGATFGTMPSVHYRSGFQFLGWFDTPNQTGGRQFTSSSPVPSGRLELWARWQQRSGAITITYSGNNHTGGSVPASQNVTTPGGVNLRPQGNLVRTGYTFVGWRDQNTNVVWRAGEWMSWGTAVSGTVRLSAEWSRNQTGNITIQYHGNNHTGGSIPSPHFVVTPGSVALRGPGNMVRAGHTFGGWRSADNRIHQPGDILTWPTARTEAINLTAIWNPTTTQFTYVRFHGNGHPLFLSVTDRFIPNTTIQSHHMPTPPQVWSGNRFGGWFNTAAASGGTEFRIGYVVPQSAAVLNFWARWSPNAQFTVNWNRNDGTNTNIIWNNIVPSVPLWQQRGVIPPYPTSTNPAFSAYRSIGWFTVSGQTGGQRVTGDTMIGHSDTTFWARWELAASPTITHPATNGERIAPRQDLNVTFQRVTNAIHRLTVVNLTTNETIVNNITVGGTSHRIVQSLLIPGNQYRITLTATPIGGSGLYSRVDRTFSVDDVTVRCDFFRFYADVEGGWLYPLRHPESRFISSGYLLPRRPSHEGIDIQRYDGNGGSIWAGIHGERVYAVHDGFVLAAQWSDSAGFWVALRSNVRDDASSRPAGSNYIVSRYLHLASNPTVSRFTNIAQGTHIGNVGNTGDVNSSGHLHLDINNGTRYESSSYVRRHAINPQRFFPYINFVGLTSDITP